MHRILVITCHWAAAFLILTMIKGGVSTPWVLALFVAIVALWTAMTAIKGMRARPGPKLSPALRRAYRPMHLAMHALLILTALAITFRLIGQPLGILDAWTLLLITLAAAAFHAIFHLWRHAALYDGALRLILPRALHRYL